MRVHDTFTMMIKVWKEISTIPPVRDAVVNIFRQFMDIRLSNSDNRLIQALTEHWWPTMHTFMFPCAEIGVTPLDFIMLTSFLISRYPTQYWFYEYCGVGHPIVKEDVKFLAYPCLRTWERGNRRYHIDHRTVDTITWEPWLESAVFEIDDVLTAKLLSRKKMPLQVPNGNCKYYLGDRCWRQLTGKARVPLDPPLSMSPHISPAA
ncbi:hypothetical protein GIB67_035120 [Kingdonia uniflora]|uniref:Aminotransferase-like plant mobile domain-containing protein n=1 Tax=Kingdonia uniflora TaxID=39325 RepID=A0A7J7NVP4_9MAGN|nr:hypothetical protein GIB67_035120 [Kingdonia uniflora]